VLVSLFFISYSISSQSPHKEFCEGVDLDERLLDDFVDLKLEIRRGSSQPVSLCRHPGCGYVSALFLTQITNSVVEKVLSLLVEKGRSLSHISSSPGCPPCNSYRPLVVTLLSIFFT
jgi:hypothetical protein